MPTKQSYDPGSFCWIELAAADQHAIKPFYESVFGWSFQDFPMGPDGVYTMFQYKGETVAAGFTMIAQMGGAPPHWGLYIACANADATAANCKENGGTVVMGPFDVGPNGRMALVKDPVGAMFHIWEGKSTPGLGIVDEPNTFCWADLSCSDPATAAKFYGAVFGWELEGKDPNGYMHINNKGTMIGGMLPAKLANPNVPPYWLVTFSVDDVRESARKAKASGATVHMEPTDTPGVGSMAVLADPQGSAFCLFKRAAGN